MRTGEEDTVYGPRAQARIVLVSLTPDGISLAGSQRRSRHLPAAHLCDEEPTDAMEILKTAASYPGQITDEEPTEEALVTLGRYAICDK